MTEMICSSPISCNAGQPDSCHPSGRGSPDSDSIQDAGSMLPDLMEQSSSKADLSPNPLVTETSTPPEEPFTAHEMSHELDDEALSSHSQEQLLPPDDFVSSSQHPEGNGEPSEIAPKDAADTIAPLPLSRPEDAETVTSSDQGELCLRAATE